MNRRVGNATASRYTYSGIGVYRPEFFADCLPGVFPLAPLLRAAADRGAVTGELYNGGWMDIGTPQRLAELDRRLNTANGDGLNLPVYAVRGRISNPSIRQRRWDRLKTIPTRRIRLGVMSI